MVISVGKNDYINEAFLSILGREADKGAVDFYEKKNLGYESLCDVLRASKEFKAKSLKRDEKKEQRNNFTQWPCPQLFVASNIKVMYCPIAKNACSSLKRLMVELSDIPGKEDLAARGDIHLQTDQFNTGIQLKDLNESEASEALYSDNYFRFCVLRDPASRILSAYWEKFVVNRLSKGNLNHTTPVLRWVYGGGYSDQSPKQGITFRQFVEYLTSIPVEQLDPHWRHQYKYVEGLDITKFYNQKDLDPLYDRLSEICGYKLIQKRSNITNSGSGQYVYSAYEMLPEKLLSFDGVSKDSFFSDHILTEIRECYSEDYKLVAMCE